MAMEMEMDPSSLFGSLDNDSNLDLSLGNFNNNCAEKQKPPLPPPPRKSISFHHRSRPSFSFTTSARPSLTAARPSFLGSSRHRPSFSTSNNSTNIDPEARHYQDPEARLKLRVFVQNFDEALQYGFPVPPFPLLMKGEQEQKNAAYILTTSINNDGLNINTTSSSINNDEKNNINKRSARRRTSSLSNTLRGRKSSSTMERSLHDAYAYGQREMTLKMTLTRPDLRTTDSSSSPTALYGPRPPSAQLLDDDDDGVIWEQEGEEKDNMIKRFWRKCRKLRN